MENDMENNTKSSEQKIQACLAQNYCEDDKSVMRVFNNKVFSLIEKKTINTVNQFLDTGL